MRLRFRYDKGIYQAIILERENVTVIFLVDDPENTWRTITNAVERVSEKVLEYYHTDKKVRWYQISPDGLFCITFVNDGTTHWTHVG